MKRITLTMVLCLSMILLVGCKGGVQSLKIDEIKGETILIRSDGTVQSAAKEKFDKKYYDINDLKDFMNETIEHFNARHEKDAVKLTKIKEEEKVVKAIFTYKDLETYCELNKIDAKLYTMEEAVEADILPTLMVNAVDNSDADLETVTKHSDYKVFTIQEKLNIKVPDSIKYYVNAAFLDAKTVEATGDDLTVIVYK